MRRAKVHFGEDYINVLIPETPIESFTGIVDSVGDADGMLFIDPGKNFTMAHTRIPLRIYFFDMSGQKLDEVDAQPLSQEPIPVPAGCKYVLEIPTGELEKSALTPYQLIGRGSKLTPLRNLMIKAIKLSRKAPKVNMFGKTYGGRQLSRTLYNNSEVLPLMGIMSPLPGPAFVAVLPYLAAKQGLKKVLTKAVMASRKAQYHRALKKRDWDKLLNMGRSDSKRVIEGLGAKLPTSYRMTLEDQRTRSGELARLLKAIIEKGEAEVKRQFTLHDRPVPPYMNTTVHYDPQNPPWL